MPEETRREGPTAAERRQARTILGRLKRRYPLIGTALDFIDPWQLLVATVLSAQTTDDNVNEVSPVLFSRWPTPEDLASAEPEEVEKVIYSTGFYRQKTRSIVALSDEVVRRYGGEVPADLDELVTLSGVGRKTASVVLSEAFDTHVGRLSNRLGFTTERDPSKIERELRRLFPKKEWGGLSMRLIQFGREVCEARRPRCWKCPLEDRCPYPAKTPPPDA
ncbi:MAG: endonuclease III [Acidimicrobiia bacterium]